MFARTKRLTLRPGWPEDAAAVAAAIGHEAVVTMLAQVPWPHTVDQARAFIERPRGPAEIALLILAHEEPRPRIVGGIGIHPAEGGARELGYWLAPSAWGRGYATEAGHAVVAIARYALGLKQLVSGHFADNPASGRVLAKLGFRPVGRAMRYSAGRGGEVPCNLFELDLAEAEAMPATALAA